MIQEQKKKKENEGHEYDMKYMKSHHAPKTRIRDANTVGWT
jgi:hypothetical protein